MTKNECHFERREKSRVLLFRFVLSCGDLSPSENPRGVRDGMSACQFERRENRACDKFPDGYILEITKEELEDLRWKFSTTKLSKTRVLPKAFTEKGLYMLATIVHPV